MRSEYDFSNARRNPYAGQLKGSHVRQQRLNDPDDFVLSRSQIRELGRRVRDADDRRRFLIASVLSRRFVLYYDVAEDVYIMNDPDGATLFKRERAARAIMAILRDGHRVVRCRVDGRGRLVKSSVRLTQVRKAKSRAGVA